MKGTAQKKEPASYEWIGDIPTGWKIEKLKRILISPLMYGTNEAAELEDKDLPRYIRITDFNGDGILREDTFKSLPFDKAEGYYLKEGDVLFARSGATVGKSFIFNNYKGRACFAGYLIKASPNLHKLSPDFLYYYTQSLAYDIWCSSIFTQATIQNISATKYAYLPIPLPSITIQHRIVAYLDKTCAAIDKAIEAKQKQLGILDALRKSIIHKAVTRGLDDSVELKDSRVEWIGRIPRNWDVRRIKSIAEIRYGLGQPPAQKDDGLPMVRATNVSAGKITDKDLIYIDARELPPGRNPYLKEGEIIVVRSGAYTGDSAIIPKRYAGAVTGYDMVITVTQAEPRFLAYSLLSDYVLNSQILLLTLRAAQPHLNAHELGGVRLSLPETRAEQREICDYLDLKLAESARITKTIVAQISTLEQYRKSLIHECVTGKRRITEDDVQGQL